MAKKVAKKANGNVFKTVVRSVIKDELKPIKEEIEKVEKRLGEKLEGVEARLNESLDEKIDKSFRQYRDDVLTGLDPLMGEIKAVREEQAAHTLNHEDINDRIDTLEAIHPQGQHPK